MPAPRASAAPRRRRLALLLAVLGSALAALAALTATVDSAAADNTPRPATIVIDSITSDVQAPTGTPNGAVPYVLVQAGGTFHVHVSFHDATGAPAAFPKDTPLSITSDRGTLSQTTGIAPKDATSATLDTSLSQAANRVSLTVAVARSANYVVKPGSSAPNQLFDVLSELRFLDTTPAASFQGGIGGDNQSCLNATSADPVCGVLILPHGAQSSRVLLSLGQCDASYAGCGSTRGSVVQALADLAGLYTRTDPAALLVKCDKSLCGGGAINKQHVSFSLNGNDALTTAPPCPAKGTVGADQQACVDYVQSTRDNSGDTLLYLLFPDDMRGSVG